MIDRTLGRSKVQGRSLIRGERLIKLRNIWFSTKAILVARYQNYSRWYRTYGGGWCGNFTDIVRTPNTIT